MHICELQQEILRLKKEQGVCILAHSYEAREICEIADFVGDSFQLSVKASRSDADTMLMCGVRFMAETVKILSPGKKVLLSSPIAGCPMAEQFDREEIAQFRAEHPEYAVVAYVNTTAVLKTVCDVCVTSSSAVKIVRQLPDDKILFIPDCNLGAYTARMVPEKEIRLMQGGCPVHAAVPAEAVKEARDLHPEALLLVHPECIPAVSEQADFVGSTAAIMDFARKSESREFIIGTEISIAEHLQYDCPDKKFYPLWKDLICSNMKATTLADVYNVLCGRGGEEIVLDADILSGARRCMDKMIELGG